MNGSRSAFPGGMKLAWLAWLLSTGLLIAAPQDPETNVNSRYTVETVIIAGNGWSTNLVSTSNDSGQSKKISAGLRQQIMALIGNKLNPPVLDELASRLRREFHAGSVTHRLQRGAAPDSVRVIFQVSIRPTRFDLSVPKFLYDARQGWSGAIDGTATVNQNSFTVGLVSNADDMLERYAGLQARYENTHLGTDRVHFAFQFETYHDQWSGGTLSALALPPDPQVTSGIYRWRQNYQPELAFVIAQPLVLTVGTSFERFQNQFPAAQTQAASAFVATLRYQGRLQDSDVQQQTLMADYSLRAATRMLGSDFIYNRQEWGGRYKLSRGKHELVDDFEAGMIQGRAPLFDRFAAGNSTSLRGWDMYEIDPLGGNRIVTNTVEYRYSVFQVFYDTGAVWDAGLPAIPRHSVGVGLRQNSFFLAVAFPMRVGGADPIFMVGMNY